MATQPAKSGKAGTMLLEEGEISRSVSKAFCMALQVGNVLGLHDSDAFWSCTNMLFRRAGSAKESSSRRFMYQGASGWAGWDRLLGPQTSVELRYCMLRWPWLMLDAS